MIYLQNAKGLFLPKRTMANKQIDMRKIKRIYELYTSGVSKRRISKQLGISRNTLTKKFIGR
ncbi:MAG: hypothetical protein CMH48_13315 [Muricauda sp.]|nr:hypothetical protein [Allomuricauda sp.]